MAGGYREVVDSIPEVIFRIDDRGVFELLSASWRSTTGFSVDESTGRPLLEFVHADDRDDVEGRLVALLCGRSDGKTFSARIVSASGAARWIEITARQLKNRTGHATGAVGTLRDVSEHHLRAMLDDTARSMDVAIMNGATERDVLAGVCESLVASTRYPLVWIGRRQKDGVQVSAFAGNAASKWFSSAPDGFTDAEGPCGAALVSTSSRHMHFDPDGLDPWHRRAIALGLASAILVPLRTRDGAVGVLVAFSDDVSSLNEHARTLEMLAGRVSLSLQLAAHQRSLEIQAAAMQSSHDALFIMSPDGDVIWVNTAFERMTGCEAPKAIGVSPVIFAEKPQDTVLLGEMWRAATAGTMWRGELGIRAQDGTAHTVMLTATPLCDRTNAVTHVVGTMVDVTAQRRAEALVTHMATHDALTQLPNRTVVVERLHALLAKDKSLAVMFIDLDRFKLVNDTLGHAAGDALLCEIGKRLQSCLREGDTVGRFGGDEFVVIAPSAGVPEHATRVASRMLEALSRPLVIAGRELYPSGSIGIALSPSDSIDAERMIEMADTAMYDAKQKGRNGFAFFAQELRDKASTGLKMHAALRRALQRAEIRVQFQPQIELATGRLVGVEALARWTCPELGVVSPATFIPLAESTGMIGALDELVLKQACTTLKAMRDKGIDLPRVCVNLSGALFANGRVTTLVDQTLGALDLPARVLEVEVNEKVLAQDAEAAAKSFDELRQRGVRIALDDFGTGYSSLTFLRKRPVDVLKLDRSFMGGLPNDRDALAIAELVFAVARTLGVDTVAEGVETSEQADALGKLGCRAIQGYLISKPLEANELEAFLAERTAKRAA